MNRLAFAALSLLAVAALAVPAESQLQSSECHNARLWHLEQALKWSVRADQDYHLGAAQAAAEMENLSGADCSTWRDDAQPPTINSQGEPVTVRAT